MADESKRMPFWARLLLLAAGATLLFTAGLTTTLAVRGKLGSFLAPMLGVADPSARVEPAAAGAAPPAASPTSPSGPTFVLPSPFTSPEASLLLDELSGARDDARALRMRLERERHDLELIRADLDLRWEELEKREADLDERELQLRANGEEVGRLRQAQVVADDKSLKTVAERVEKMEPDKAVELLRKMPAERVAEILKRVKPRESGRILGTFDAEFAADVSAHMLGAEKPAPSLEKP
jgi:flagellar motility protein MotE (MotC chaperone)